MQLPKFLLVHLRMKLCSGYNISYEVDFLSSEIRLILHVSLYTINAIYEYILQRSKKYEAVESKIKVSI